MCDVWAFVCLGPAAVFEERRRDEDFEVFRLMLKTNVIFKTNLKFWVFRLTSKEAPTQRLRTARQINQAATLLFGVGCARRSSWPSWPRLVGHLWLVSHLTIGDWATETNCSWTFWSLWSNRSLSMRFAMQINNFLLVNKYWFFYF